MNKLFNVKELGVIISAVNFLLFISCQIAFKVFCTNIETYEHYVIFWLYVHFPLFIAFINYLLFYSSFLLVPICNYSMIKFDKKIRVHK